MSTIRAFLLACATLVLTGCGTAPKPTAADEPFEKFYARMIATYAPEAAPRPARAEVEAQPATNTDAQPLNPTPKTGLTDTNQSLFALPPPLLQLPEQKAAREEVEKSGVSPALVQKMLQGQILTLAEIQELAQHKVSDTNLVKYLRSTGAIYTLTTKQIDELRAASVSNEVLDYLLSTPALRRVFYYPTLFPSYLYQPSYRWWDYHHFDYDLLHYDLHHYDVHHNSGHH